MMEKRSSKSQSLLRVQQLELVCLDLNLYLDTHPDDEKALECFKKYNKMLKEVTMEFESNFGPISASSVCEQKDEVWLWAEKPWPWEIKRGGFR